LQPCVRRCGSCCGRFGERGGLGAVQQGTLTIVPLGFIPLFIPVPAFLFAFVWFGLQVLQGSTELASPGMAASVAWWAHIGGFMFGALVALLAHHAPPPAPVPTRVWRHTSGWRVPDVRQHFPRD
jgi:Rhomboid family